MIIPMTKQDELLLNLLDGCKRPIDDEKAAQLATASGFTSQYVKWFANQPIQNPIIQLNSVNEEFERRAELYRLNSATEQKS